MRARVPRDETGLLPVLRSRPRAKDHLFLHLTKGKPMLLTALLIVAGLIGYFVGRRSKRHYINALEHAVRSDGFAMRSAEIRLSVMAGERGDEVHELRDRIDNNRKLLKE